MSESNNNNEQLNLQSESASNANPDVNSSAPPNSSPAQDDEKAKSETSNNARNVDVSFLYNVYCGVAWVIFTFWNYCVQNAKLLLGSMASGSMLGLFFSLFLSMIITPLMFYAFNSNFPNYDEYFKPKNNTISKEDKEVISKDKTDTFTIGHPSVNQNNGKENVFKYTVSSQKQQRELFSVNIQDSVEKPESSANNNSQSIVRKLTISIKKAAASDKSEKSPNEKDEIKWYKTSNIANSNSIFEVATKYVVLKNASYPTSITAFISWIKDYGKDELELKNTNEDDLQKIASALERILENDWEFQNKNKLELLFARSVNGSIQFLCVLLFNAIIILLIARNTVVLYYSPLHDRYEKMIEAEKITVDRNACEKKMFEYSNTWGMESPMLAMWRSALIQKDNNSIISLSEISERVNNTMQSSFSYISFMADTIPALGFVGTIIGIGQTMLNTSSVISNELGKQQSRISEVSLNLAFAFDTTLIALLLSMVIGFLITVEMRQEEKRIQNIAEDISNKNWNDTKSN